MNFRWFISSSVRHATDACKHVEKLLAAQRDLLAPQAIEAVSAALGETRGAINANADNETLAKHLENLEKAAAKWIKPYPNAEWRENVEVFLVAIAVAMAIRTFFLQPFKIPTGSMQPTLFGVMTSDLHDDLDFKMPSLFERAFDLIVKGEIYHDIVAPDDCRFVDVEPSVGPSEAPGKVMGFLNKQDIVMEFRDGHRQAFTVWAGPDDHLDGRLNLRARSVFRKGEPIARFKETTGDHLFVDRFSYNFRHPARGEIVVFKTKGIEGIPNQGDFYIKRLVGLPGETLSIGVDRHVRVNGQRLDANSASPHFENVYGFDPDSMPRQDHYSGHILAQNYPGYDVRLRQPSDTLVIRPRHFVVFGDNTVNSLDSRFWGDFPEENVIGKSFFVYWPYSHRMGWGQQ